MRLTNHVPKTVLWSFLLGVTLSSSAAAQQPAPAQPPAPTSQPPLPPPAKEERPGGARGGVLIVPINGTQRVQMSNKRNIDTVLNPRDNVVRVTQVLNDPTSVLVTGLDSGVARITLIGKDANGKEVQENVDILVQFDVEYLRTLLTRVVPTAAVNPVPAANGAIILSGTVGRAEDVDIIMRTTASVVGGPERIVNAMRVGGVMQVQLDTVVATVNRSAIRSMGFNLLQSGPSAIFGNVVGNLAPVQTAGTVAPSTFSGNGTTGSAGGSGAGSQSGLITGGAINSAPGAANLFLGVVTKSGSFFGFLEALRNEGLVKLLTEPRLVTLSGQPANLHSGGQQAIPESGGLGTTTIKFEKFGTDLTYLPIVLGNGKIHLDIETIVSQLDNAAGVNLNGFFIPGRADQYAHTVVEIEDGQTLAIGGLIQHVSNAATNKVPILGDLPYVGAAFSTKSFTDSEIELVILVTPHVVDPMACNQLPKSLPGEETRKPDDYELFLEGILEAPRGPRVPFPDKYRFVPAYKNGPTSALYPCAADGRCGQPVHPAADPASDSSSHVNKLPVGNTEAKPLPPIAATPLGNAEPKPLPPVATAASSPGTSPAVETAPTAEANKPAEGQNMPATLPAALPGPATTEGKQ